MTKPPTSNPGAYAVEKFRAGSAKAIPGVLASPDRERPAVVLTIDNKPVLYLTPFHAWRLAMQIADTINQTKETK